MATSRLILPVPAPFVPDGSGSGNAPAGWEKIVSPTAQTTNTPKLTYYHNLFDPATDEHVMWTFQLPGDYASGGTVRLLWGSKVTTGDVLWKAGIEIADPSSTDIDAATYNAADTAAASTVPGTVGQYKETTIALTMTGATAGDWVGLFVGRDADAAGDTAAGDACLVAASFEYVS